MGVMFVFDLDDFEYFSEGKCILSQIFESNQVNLGVFKLREVFFNYLGGKIVRYDFFERLR